MKSPIATNAKKITNKRTPNNKRSSNKLSTPKKSRVKKVKEKPPPPSLPEGWPVSTSNPFLLSTATTVTSQKSRKPHEKQTPQSEADEVTEEEGTSSRSKDGNDFSNESVQLGLPPGTMLQKCTGEDIQLSKNSDARPNFAMGRGRFLFVLPGMLSLRPAAPSPSTTTPLKSINGNAEKGGTDEAVSCETTIKDLATDQANKSHDVVLKQEQSSGKPKTASSDSTVENILSSPVPPPSTLQSLGKVKNLKSSNPSLVIPLPNGQTLIFKGRKIPCTSRFLVLTCRSSGKVQCRDVFQEIVVFGDVALTPPSDIKATTTQTLSALRPPDKKNTAPASSDEIKNSHDNNSEGGEKQEFHHYGGSERTVDGGKCLKLSKIDRRGGVGATAQNQKNQKIHDKSRKDHEEPSSLSSPRKKRKLSTATDNKYCTNEDDDDSSKDGDADDSVTIVNNKTEGRRNDSSGEDSEETGTSDDEEYTSHARGEMSTPLQSRRKRSSRLSSSTKTVKYSFQSDNDSDNDRMQEEDSVTEDSIKCKEPESDDADSRISEAHDSPITKATSRSRRQSSGKKYASSIGKEKKRIKENSLSSSIDLTNDSEPASKVDHGTKHMKNKSYEAKTRKANSNDCDGDGTIGNTSTKGRRNKSDGENSEGSGTSDDNENDEEEYTSHASGEMSTPLQSRRKRSARLSSNTKKVKYSIQSDNDNDNDNDNSIECKEREGDDADSRISEAHDSHTTSTTKTTPRPRRQSSGNKCPSSTGKKEKNQKGKFFIFFCRFDK